MSVPWVPAIMRVDCIVFAAALQDALSVASLHTFATTDGIFNRVA